MQSLKISTPRRGQRARRYQIAMHWNGGLVEARHNHKRQVFSAQHTYATDFFLHLWYDSIEKCFFGEFLVANIARTCQKYAWTYFVSWQIKG